MELQMQEQAEEICNNGNLGERETPLNLTISNSPSHQITKMEQTNDDDKSETHKNTAKNSNCSEDEGFDSYPKPVNNFTEEATGKGNNDVCSNPPDCCESRSVEDKKVIIQKPKRTTLPPSSTTSKVGENRDNNDRRTTTTVKEEKELNALDEQIHREESSLPSSSISTTSSSKSDKKNKDDEEDDEFKVKIRPKKHNHNPNKSVSSDGNYDHDDGRLNSSSRSKSNLNLNLNHHNSNSNKIGIGTSSTSSSSSIANSKRYSSSTLSLYTKPGGGASSFFPPLGTLLRNKSKNSGSTMSMSMQIGDGSGNAKITGYLEKRSKMLGWKKYWFVLDGRLLAYYKSKNDYESLSSFCGSINLGIASSVRPVQIKGCKGNPIQIVTRSQVYYVRSPDKQILEQWLLAIQEAASSKPCIISSPLWADPGSQFFRYSFAESSSQWSLNTSTDDISERLNKLPQNFYLRGGNKNSSNFNSVSPTTAPKSNGSRSSAPKKFSNNSDNKYQRFSSLQCLHSDIVTMTDPPQYNNNNNNNPVSSAFKEELSRKLSLVEMGESETVRPSLTTNNNNKQHSRSELPFLRQRKDSSSSTEAHPPHNHVYDEIIDFEAIYENTGDSSTSNSNSNRSTFEEDEVKKEEEMKEVEDDDKPVPHKEEEGYEVVHPTPQQQSSNDSIRRHNPTDSNTNNRNSGGTQKPHHYHQEIPKKQGVEKKSSVDSTISQTSTINSSKENVSSSSELGTKKKKKPFGGFFHKMFNKKDKSNKSKSSGSKQDESVVITGPIDLRCIHKDSPLNRPTNLPVDEARKNSLGRSNKKTTSPAGAGSAGSGTLLSSSPEHEKVMDELKHRVSHHHHALPLTSIADQILSKAQQRRLSEEDGEECSNSNAIPFIDETDNNGSSSMVKNKKPVCTLKRATLTKPPPILPKPQKETIIPPSTLPLPTPESDAVRLRKSPTPGSEDFQKKLAKFNRLSASLSSTFAAALCPPPSTYPTVGGLGRSHSFKFPQRKLEESLPPLPPKKKNSPSSTIERNLYDRPGNNKPVPPVKKFKGAKATTVSTTAPCIVPPSISASTPPKEEEEDDDVLDMDEPVGFIRTLCKKNSAPDIMFPSSGSSCATDSERNSGRTAGSSLEDILNLHLVPPPVPPKTYSNPNLGSPSTPSKAIDDDYKVPTGTPIPVPVPALEEKPKPKEVFHPYENCPTEMGSNTQAKKSSPTDSQSNAKSSSGPELNLKYAQVNTLMQEYETVELVEDTEAEMAEMYDDFPSGLYSGSSGGGSHTYESISPYGPSPQNHANHHYDEPTHQKQLPSCHYDNDEDESNRVHPSQTGIEALQSFLDSEVSSSVPSSKRIIVAASDGKLGSNKPIPPARPLHIPSNTGGGGVVNRLGHSSAIDQLRKLVSYTKSDV